MEQEISLQMEAIRTQTGIIAIIPTLLTGSDGDTVPQENPCI